MKTLLILIAAFAFYPLYAQDNNNEGQTWEEYVNTINQPEHPQEIQETTSYQGEPVKLRPFSKEDWKEIIGSTRYDEEVPDNIDKSRSENDHDAVPNEVMTSEPWSGNGLQIISFMLIFAVVLIFLYVILKNVSLGGTKLRRATPSQGLHHQVDDIQELEVDWLLREARNSGNLRLVIRLHYLGLLKSLHEKSLIRWEKDKTNREYLAEIFTREWLYNDVKKLTLAYETIWYGEHHPEAQYYHSLIAGFESIHEILNTRNR